MQINQHLEEKKNVVADTLQLAQEKGATHAEASMSRVEGIAISARMIPFKPARDPVIIWHYSKAMIYYE